MSDLATGLHDVFIIETSGICIFEQEFMPLPKRVNKDLMGGFLTAIDAFSDEMTGQKIQVIHLETISLYYNVSGKLYFVIVVARDIDHGRIQSFLSHIQQRFETIYGEYVEKGNFSNVSKFESFAVELEREVGKTSQHHTIFSEPVEIVKAKYEAARKRVQLIKQSYADSVTGIIDKNVRRILRLFK